MSQDDLVDYVNYSLLHVIELAQLLKQIEMLILNCPKLLWI